MLYYVILSLKLINEFISNAKVLIFETYINKTLLGYLFNIYFITVLLLVEIYDMDYHKDKYIELILSRYGLFNIFSSIHYFSDGYIRNELYIAYYYLKCLNPCHLAMLLIRQTYLHPDYLYLCVQFGIMSDVTSYISKVPLQTSYEVLAKFKRRNEYDIQYNTIEFTTMHLPYHHLLKHFIQNITFFNFFDTLLIKKR